MSRLWVTSYQPSTLRHDLSRLMTTRGVPALIFLYDKTIARAQRIDEIIGSFNKGEDDSNSD